MFGIKSYKTLSHKEKAKRNLMGFVIFLVFAVFGYYLFQFEGDTAIIGGFLIFIGVLYMLYYLIVGPINIIKSRKE